MNSLNPVHLSPVVRSDAAQTTSAQRGVTAPLAGGFAQVLAGELGRNNEIRFSAHAAQRLAQRDIEMSDADRERIATAIDSAAARGARDALLLLDHRALVVNIPSRTVITVMAQDESASKVFTNIDSAVVVP